MAYLSPWEIIGYQNRIDQNASGYNTAEASRDYDTRMLGINQERDQYDLGLQQQRNIDALPGSFVRRGILNSGIYQKAYGDLANQRATQTSRLNTDYTNRGARLTAQGGSNYNNYSQTLAGINAESTARQAEVATYLDGNQG